MPLVIALTAMTLLTALGSALVVVTMTETAIAASYREGIEVFYAAEAAVEFAIHELTGLPEWDEMTLAHAVSSFTDGPPDGARPVGAELLDLADATRDVNETASGEGTDAYGLYAYGRFVDLLPNDAGPLPIYVAVWVAPGSNGDGEAAVVRVIGRAYGPRGSRRGVAVAVARMADPEADASPGVRVNTWHELR